MQGQLGIELAAQHQPDLILLDLHLPDIDGEEVLRRLRADERTARHPGDHPLGRRHARAGRAPQGAGRRATTSPSRSSWSGSSRPSSARSGEARADGRRRPARATQARARGHRRRPPGLPRGRGRARSTAVPSSRWSARPARGEALEGIRSLAPDVAVIDLGLPDFDGIAVIGMLEREGSATRVVIVSASEDGPTIYRAFAHGARAYIPKVSRATCSAARCCGSRPARP